MASYYACALTTGLHVDAGPNLSWLEILANQLDLATPQKADYDRQNGIFESAR